jgi:hypothetical protein
MLAHPKRPERDQVKQGAASQRAAEGGETALVEHTKPPAFVVAGPEAAGNGGWSKCITLGLVW